MAIFSAVAATGTLTTSANPGNTETVTIGNKVYTFQTSLTNVDGNVFIGASEAASLQNLYDAINLTGTPGTQYATLMTKHDYVRATAVTTHTVVLKALLPGTQGNLITSTETLANGSFGGAVFASGTGSAHANLKTWVTGVQASMQLNAQVQREFEQYLSEVPAS